METTWIEIGGFLVQAPVTAGTNLVLGVQCTLYFRRLRAGPGAQQNLWSAFFLMMAIATLAGVVKHGFGHELSETGLLLVLWVSSLTGGISTYYAQRATAVTHAPAHLKRRFDRLFQIQLFVFLVANVALGPQILLLVVNTAVGLLPVIGVEAMALRRGHPGSGWIAGGLSVSILTGAVYVLGLSLGPWLNHIDIAHVLMGASFWLLVRGCRPHQIAPRDYLVAWPLIRRIANPAISPVDRLAREVDRLVREHDDDGRHMRRMTTGPGGF